MDCFPSNTHTLAERGRSNCDNCPLSRLRVLFSKPGRQAGSKSSSVVGLLWGQPAVAPAVSPLSVISPSSVVGSVRELSTREFVLLVGVSGCVLLAGRRKDSMTAAMMTVVFAVRLVGIDFLFSIVAEAVG